MGDVDELKFDTVITKRHRRAGLHLDEVVLDAELLFALDLLFDQLNRKRGCDNRRVIAVGELRDRPDVIEVPVCGDNRFHVSLDVGHHPVVGDGAHVDEIQTVHPLGLDVVVDQHLREV